jgi:tRNA U34 5-methylaminomethyl-2-thiouridine-forming methyltransferase MnmC
LTDNVLITTEDGSHSLTSAQFGVNYHSVHGAIQESKHVFIQSGLHALIHQSPVSLNILEMGLGTGLNLLLTMIEIEKLNIQINYTALEAYPISVSTARNLNYLELLNRRELKADFLFIHQCEFENSYTLCPNLSFQKFKSQLENIDFKQKFNLIYFDAFAPEDQPELWTIEIFKKLFNASHHKGVLVTYCAKGEVRRSLQSVGWEVERIPGPSGKREMIRAIKP